MAASMAWLLLQRQPVDALQRFGVQWRATSVGCRTTLRSQGPGPLSGPACQHYQRTSGHAMKGRAVRVCPELRQRTVRPQAHDSHRGRLLRRHVKPIADATMKIIWAVYRPRYVAIGVSVEIGLPIWIVLVYFYGPGGRIPNIRTELKYC
jgi:hypothetical protein